MRTHSDHRVYSTSIGMGSPINGLANRDEPKLRLSTTAARVRQAILDLIVSGKIGMGSRLDQRKLAKQLKTTTAPLREAMSALEAEGILIRQQGLGVFCRIYTVLEVEEMIEIRGVLEALSARRASIHATEADIAELRELATQICESVPPGGEQKFVEIHIKFHRRLLQISRSPRLQKLLVAHHLIEDILANIIPNLWPNDPNPQSHMRLVDALASRDPDRAEQAMRHAVLLSYEKRFVALRARFGDGLILPSPAHGASD